MKTKLTRHVPEHRSVNKFTKRNKHLPIPKDHYVFSEDFKPGEANIPRKRATEMWKKHVIDHLKIEKKLYGVKHLGIDDKKENHTSLYAVSQQAGHATKQKTARYSKKLKKVYAEEISEKSKGFLE